MELCFLFVYSYYLENPYTGPRTINLNRKKQEFCLKMYGTEWCINKVEGYPHKALITLLLPQQALLLY